MDEADYWRRLEHRICAEFTGFADRHLRHYWCDGLIPDEYDLDADEPCIRGRAWCGSAPAQELWSFTLLVGHAANSPADIDWPTLLPEDHKTGWLGPDTHRKTLRIDPLAAYDDE
jgi:hypothetical protein